MFLVNFSFLVQINWFSIFLCFSQVFCVLSPASLFLDTKNLFSITRYFILLLS